MAAAAPNQLLSDLVLDSRLETEFAGSCTQHVFYTSGRSVRQRRVRRVERWTRETLLGNGAYGIVYRERCDGERPRFRAVKEIKKLFLKEEELDYTRELEAIVKFSHPRYSHCFVRSDGWYEDGVSVFIAMEYLELGDLAVHLTRALPENEAQQIVSQVLEGLKYMHENGFVHRDIKPGNIMVVTKGPDWFVKVADFGISKRRRQDCTITLTHQRGTLGFAAPEQLGLFQDEDGNTGSSSFGGDMWSLGAVAYKLLTNSTPFPNLMNLVSYVSGTGHFPTESLQANGVSEEGQDLLLSLMSPKPHDRPSAEACSNHPWIDVEEDEAAEVVENSHPEANDEQEPENSIHVSEPSVAWSADLEITPAAPSAKSTHETRPPGYVPPFIEDCEEESATPRPDLLPLDSLTLTNNPARSKKTARAREAVGNSRPEPGPIEELPGPSVPKSVHPRVHADAHLHKYLPKPAGHTTAFDAFPSAQCARCGKHFKPRRINNGHDICEACIGKKQHIRSDEELERLSVQQLREYLRSLREREGNEQDEVDGGDSDGSSSSSSSSDGTTDRSEYPKKGQTRIPSALLSKQAVVDLGYSFTEEGRYVIIQKALGQDNIDELLELSEGYNKRELEVAAAEESDDDVLPLTLASLQALQLSFKGHTNNKKRNNDEEDDDNASHIATRGSGRKFRNGYFTTAGPRAEARGRRVISSGEERRLEKKRTQVKWLTSEEDAERRARKKWLK